MTMPTHTAHHQRGLTLVEVMVALVIGLVLMAGVIELFIGSRQTYTLHESMSRVQENGRFALDNLNQDLRMAGHMGCANARIMQTEPTPPSTYLMPGRVRVILDGTVWNMQSAIDGSFWTGANWIPAKPASAATSLTGSDVLTLRGASGSRFMITAQNPGTPEGSGSEPLLIPLDSGIKQNDILMVGDCSTVAIFQVTNSDADIKDNGRLEHVIGVGTPGNATQNLGRDFDTSARVLGMSSRTYFIGTGASGNPALFRSVNDNPADELVEGVERMRISYGVGVPAADGTLVPAAYQTADVVDAAGDWGNVISVRISLLLRSDDNVTDTSQAYTYTSDAGVEIIPADRRMRQVFTTTIGLRSWLP